MPSFFNLRLLAAEKTNLAIMWKYLGSVDKVRKIYFYGLKANVWWNDT